MKNFLIIIVMFCFVNSSISISQESIKKKDWELNESFFGEQITGTVINVFEDDGTCIIPIFDKSSGSVYSQVKFGESGWEKLDVVTWGNILVENKNIFIAHIDSFENRKKWKISRISFDGSIEVSEHEMASYPDARYVHHTSVVKTSDNILYAIAGIYRGKDDVYSIYSSKDNGKTWLNTENSFEGFSAHDDTPTVFKSFGNDLLFFGYPSDREVTKKNGGKLVKKTGDEWTEVALPHNKVWLANFEESDGVLHVVYGVKKESWKMDIYYSSTTDLNLWSKPVSLAKDLTMEDVLMQMPPRLLIMGNNVLVAFADIYGRWTKGEYNFRFFASDDKGKSWSEMDWKKSLKKIAHISLFTNNNQIFAAIGQGSFRKMLTFIGSLTKSK